MLPEEQTPELEEEREHTTRWLNRAELSTWMAFWGAMHVVNNALDQELEIQCGLSHNDYQILVMLSNAPEHQLRMSELAERIFGSRSRLTYQVTQLERGGLVRRENCFTDKRGAVAVLTSQGQALLQKVAPGHIESIRHLFFDQLTPEQVTIIGDGLRAVITGQGQAKDLDTFIERELNRE